MIQCNREVKARKPDIAKGREGGGGFQKTEQVKKNKKV